MGKPRRVHQTIHRDAPTAAARTTTAASGTGGRSTSSVPMTLATSVPTSAPAKLRAADQRRATVGDRTRVDTTVATALAASFQPFAKAKTRVAATTSEMVATGSMDRRSGLLPRE